MIAPSPLKRVLFFVLSDILISLVTLYLAYSLRFNFSIDEKYLKNFFLVFAILVTLKVFFIFVFKVYQVAWRFMSLNEAKKLFYVHLIVYPIFVLIYYLFPEPFTPFPRSVLIIDFFLSVIFLGILRMAKRLLIEGQDDKTLKKTLLIGATSFGQTLFKEKKDYYISAVVEDSEALIDSYFANKRIQKLDDLEQVIKSNAITSVIIAKVYSKLELQAIFRKLNDLGIYDIRVVSLEKKDKKLKKVTVEDLLARHPQDLDSKVIEQFVKDKSVLITGAGGSIGSEIAKQCEQFGASDLILVDHGEYNLYQISELLPNATAKLLNITNKPLLEEIFETYKPDIVIHAAAYKHVPVCEANPETAVYNNVYGSKNVIDVSIKYQVKKVVMISTDKAVRPTNVMGATKRVTELYANNVEAENTEIVAVRFGNVLGSSGSVIPKFKEQIEKGGPVTVTHPEITRYFMLIPEACQLVLQAASIAKGGELFILDMGEPVKIVDLAKQMIRLYGKENEVNIEFTGLRPGEKLYEELLLDESEQKTKYSSIFIAHPTGYEIDTLQKDIDQLLKADDKIAALQKIVPEFKRNV